MSAQETDLEIGELGEGLATVSSPAREIVATGSGSSAITRSRRRGSRRSQQQLGLGECGVDDPRVVAAAAAPAERLDRRLEVARVGDGDDVVRGADDPKRPRISSPPRLRVSPFHPSAPSPGRARGPPPRAGEAAGKQPPALAEVRRRQLELLPTADELLGDQARALGQRPVVSEPADEIADVLRGLRGRAQHLRAALEVDLIAPTELAK